MILVDDFCQVKGSLTPFEKLKLKLVPVFPIGSFALLIYVFHICAVRFISFSVFF